MQRALIDAWVAGDGAAAAVGRQPTAPCGYDDWVPWSEGTGERLDPYEEVPR